MAGRGEGCRHSAAQYDGQAAADDARPRPPENKRYPSGGGTSFVRVDPQRLVHAPHPHLPPLRRRLRLCRLPREAVQRLAAALGIWGEKFRVPIGGEDSTRKVWVFVIKTSTPKNINHLILSLLSYLINPRNLSIYLSICKLFSPTPPPPSALFQLGSGLRA